MRPLTTNSAIRLSSGEVIKSENYNYRTKRPEPGGLFDEAIFGTMQPPVVVGSDNRKDRWGHIRLGSDCAHPLFADHHIEVVLVPPPCYRQFHHEFLSAEAQQRKFTELSQFIDSNGGVDASGNIKDKALLETFGTLSPSDLEDRQVIRESTVNTYYRGLLDTSSKIRRFKELGVNQPLINEVMER